LDTLFDGFLVKNAESHQNASIFPLIFSSARSWAATIHAGSDFSKCGPLAAFPKMPDVSRPYPCPESQIPSATSSRQPPTSPVIHPCSLPTMRPQSGSASDLSPSLAAPNSPEGLVVPGFSSTPGLISTSAGSPVILCVTLDSAVPPSSSAHPLVLAPEKVSPSLCVLVAQEFFHFPLYIMQRRL
jgi:hypothetical protein